MARAEVDSPSAITGRHERALGRAAKGGLEEEVVVAHGGLEHDLVRGRYPRVVVARDPHLERSCLLPVRLAPVAARIGHRHTCRGERCGSRGWAARRARPSQPAASVNEPTAGLVGSMRLHTGGSCVTFPLRRWHLSSAGTSQPSFEYWNAAEPPVWYAAVVRKWGAEGIARHGAQCGTQAAQLILALRRMTLGRSGQSGHADGSLTFGTGACIVCLAACWVGP